MNDSFIKYFQRVHLRSIMPRKSTRQMIAGYGAKLRDRLRAASVSQVELANATGLSRQTIAKALGDLASARTIRLIDDVLRARGSARSLTPLSTDSTAPASASPVSGAARPRSNAWATATDLHQWSDRRDAQEDLPRVI